MIRTISLICIALTVGLSAFAWKQGAAAAKLSEDDRRANSCANVMQEPATIIERCTALLDDGYWDRPRLLSSRAVAYIRLGDLDQAERDAEAALEAYPDYQYAKALLGRIDVARGNDVAGLLRLAEIVGDPERSETDAGWQQARKDLVVNLMLGGGSDHPVFQSVSRDDPRLQVLEAALDEGLRAQSDPRAMAEFFSRHWAK